MAATWDYKQEKIMMNVDATQLGEFKDQASKNILIRALREQEVVVSFKKADGTMRNMKCTLMESKIPDDKKPKGTEKSKNDSVLPVFDVEKDAWRSFRWDSVEKVAFAL